MQIKQRKLANKDLISALSVAFLCLSLPQSALANGELQSKEVDFNQVVAPFLQKYCVRCHNADEMMSGIRVDQLSAEINDSQLALLKGISHQISESVMPPEDEAQPSEAERSQFLAWANESLVNAMSRKTDRFGTVRRLTVAQYQNTLSELLHLDDDFTASLPPDGVSKDGFVNHAQTLLLSPLQVEAYFDIAEKALDKCIVDEHDPPEVQHFRMDIGEKINPAPFPDKLILGHLSHLLNNSDIVVSELSPQKPFAYQAKPMQTHFEFIEGYVGNDTVKQWRKFDSIYHAVFACLRGTPDYLKGDATEIAPEGLLLRPAVPSSEIFGVSNTYGPMANFKIALRELPESGNFRVTVKAARYDDALLLEPGSPVAIATSTVVDAPTQAASNLRIDQAGIYQFDIAHGRSDKPAHLALSIDGRRFSGSLPASVGSQQDQPGSESVDAFGLVRLEAGDHSVTLTADQNMAIHRLNISPVERGSSAEKQFIAFEGRVPQLGVHLGLRRDCGSTLNHVGEPQAVRDTKVQKFVFNGAISNFPSPDVEPGNVNYLAGLREIAVRNEYTDGRDAPRLIIQSVEFEGPYHEQWPPANHQCIFIDSNNKDKPELYSREIVGSFASRAFRRQVTEEELQVFWEIWNRSYAATSDFKLAIKNALTVVLTSPQFLFIIEESDDPEANELSDVELASKLSYFLWNSPPDEQLMQLANAGHLHEHLDDEVDRMISDHRFALAMTEFVRQWLSLDKFDVVSIDSASFPNLTKHAKQQLRREPVEFVQYLIRNNLPLRNIVHSDFMLANEVVASYYGIGEATESGFEFVPIPRTSDLGGVLAQAAVLSGLSDGREPNPVKRGAWFARKIIAEPPPDPPPNVPQLPKDKAGALTLRQKLEQHREQKGCANCHKGIDPWGLPFEQYDAAGLLRKADDVDASSELPDGTTVENVQQLKHHLINDRMDQVAFSFLKHVATYATGRTLTYNELEHLKSNCSNARDREYLMRDLIKSVIHSDIFLKK